MHLGVAESLGLKRPHPQKEWGGCDVKELRSHGVAIVLRRVSSQISVWYTSDVPGVVCPFSLSRAGNRRRRICFRSLFLSGRCGDTRRDRDRDPRQAFRTAGLVVWGSDVFAQLAEAASVLLASWGHCEGHACGERGCNASPAGSWWFLETAPESEL